MVNKHKIIWYHCAKFDENIFIDDRDRPYQKSKCKIAAAAILNFTKIGLLGYNNPGMANIYLQTKFGANQSRNCRDTPV